MPLLHKAKEMMYTPSINKLAFFENDKKALYEIAKAGFMPYIPYYIESFFLEETEERKQELLSILKDCAIKRYYPCETFFKK